MPMQDHDALPSTDPADTELSAAAEAPATGTNQPSEASPHRPNQTAVPASDAAHPESDTDRIDEADDDGPVELDDPFSGSEDAQPVMLDGEEEEADEDEPSLADMDWYILKVQSNREDSIRDTLLRRISMQGMDRWFGEVVVPKEQVTEFKSGKKRVVWRKLYPGYILVNMVLNDETWFLVRETGGIGDFTGSGGKPSPMLPQDVAKLLHKVEEKAEETPKLKINFKKGDRVKINEGTFENFEGEVEQIDEANGRVTVMLSIFGRSTPVDIEYWQIETV
jgi:transcriptional antiterminator NusG